MFASMAIGNVSICCSLSRKIGHWHHWKVCLASSTRQIDQLSHRSGWIICRKNLHIVTLAKVGATCSCTVLHKGSFKHWWWHSLQRSWHRLVDLVTDMSRHLSLICRITSKTSKWVGEPDYCSDMLRQPSSTSKMQMVHCTRAKAKKHGKTIPQTRLISKRAWKARQCMTSCVMLA